MWWWHGKEKYWKSTKCSTKKKAIRVISSWPTAYGTLGEYAEELLEKALRYRQVKPNTEYGHRNNLTKIVEQFRDRELDALTSDEIDDWLYSMDCKNSTKNTIINTFQIILKEAKRKRLLTEIPDIRRYARADSVRKDILTADEIQTLFPPDELDLAKIWGDWSHALLFSVMLQSGMRPPEARALHVEQLYPEHNTILIDRQLNAQLEIDDLKKSTADDKRIRFSRISSRLMDSLETYIELNELEGLLFTFDQKPLTKENLRWTWDRALELTRIQQNPKHRKKDDPPPKRKLTPYSLRYTWRSRMAGRMTLKDIMEAQGHKSEEMSRHYLQIDPEMFSVFDQYQDRIDEVWGE